MNGRVLIVAGSDSGGGAGIQADIKTVTALGGYAATAITALTAQNTRGVFSVVGIDPSFIAQQMRLVLEDIGADAIKTGMLHSAEVVVAVCEVLETMARGIPLVVDPVMVAKSGTALLNDNARAAVLQGLMPLAAVLTPNIPEAEALTGITIRDPEGMVRAGEALRRCGAKAVLVKGGHQEGDMIADVLVSQDGVEIFRNPRIQSRHTHGTGCTLASAIATGLAQKRPLREAVRRAGAYVQEAIRTAPGLGGGHGPLNHGHTVREFNV